MTWNDEAFIMVPVGTFQVSVIFHPFTQRHQTNMFRERLPIRNHFFLHFFPRFVILWGCLKIRTQKFSCCRRQITIDSHTSCLRVTWVAWVKQSTINIKRNWWFSVVMIYQEASMKGIFSVDMLEIANLKPPILSPNEANNKHAEIYHPTMEQRNKMMLKTIHPKPLA